MSEGNGLPRGWTVARIDAFATTATGGTPSRKNPRYFGGAIPWVKSGELGDGRVYHSEETLTDAGVEESNAKLFPAGTLCIALYGATVGKLGILEVQATTNQAVCGIFLPPEVLRSYLFHFLLSIRSRLVEQGKGGAQSNISNGLVRETIVPLAPLPEQHRIVEKIEELFSDLDAGVASLQRAKANLKRYRASVLKSAVEGRLTEEWRKEHPQTEDGQMLLDRILRERQERWEKDQLLKFKEKGKEPPKNWESRYEEPSAPDGSELPELPEGWVWATVEQLSVVVRGSSPRPAGDPRYFGGTVPWITVGPITADNEPYLKQVPEGLTEEGRENSRFIEPHTLLLTNSGATLGVPKITLIGGCINDGVAALLETDYPLKLYLLYFLRTETAKLRGVNQGAAQPNLNTSIIKAIWVPLPPLAEQEQIVSLVEERLSQIDSAAKTIDEELIRSKRLRQSILKRAFEGKLVPQNPKDEPASVLLERIKASREADQPKKKAKKVKAK
jgi:type I restriction enzyme S subunit